MKFKIVSKLLATTLFLSNINIYSLAGTLSDDGRYESFEGNSINIENILEENEIDIEVEGNTLVNYSHIKSYTASNETSTNNNPTIKPGVGYTFYCNITDVSGDDIEGPFMRIHYSGDSNQFSNIIDTKYEVGEYIKTFTVSPEKEIDNYYFGWIRNYQEGQYAVMDNIMILEGTYTLDTIPEYFEGIKSVGQDDINGHNIKITSETKNLLPNSEGWEDGQLYEDGNLSTSELYNIISISTKDYIKLKGGQNYTFSYPPEYELAYHVWDTEFNYIKDSKWITQKTIKPTSDCYIKVTTRIKASFDGSIETANKYPTYPNHVGNKLTVQLEEGDAASSYSPQNSQELNIKLKEPLRGLPNGVKDRIIKKDGQWVVERNCAELILKDEMFDEIHIWDSNIHRVTFDISYFKGIKKGNWTADMSPQAIFEAASWKAFRGNSSDSGTWFHSQHQTFHILCPVGTTREEAINKYAGTRVVYHLAKPVYEYLNMGPSIKIFKSETQISNDSIIPANMKTTVDRTVNIAVEAIELAKVNPTTENLAKARMWVNMLKESTLKDSLQEEISNVTQLEDLTFEKKTVSANLDVYIKSENMLSMSLDTNSVTFDGYSGVADMEKLGAVNLTINSSLPYSLNAYMPAEISNANSSAKIPFDVFNIKESTETAYEHFENSTDKVVLKDTCEKGNGNTHVIDLKLSTNAAHKADIYKTVLKFEAVQK